MPLDEEIATTNCLRQADIDEDVLTTVDVSAAEVGSTVRAVVNEAVEESQTLPEDTAGCLFVDEGGFVVTDASAIVSGVPGIRGLGATKGGRWLSSPGIDWSLIQRVIEAFDWERDIRDQDTTPARSANQEQLAARHAPSPRPQSRRRTALRH